jgi:RNA polymerase sigma factor (sigma-70 family)
MADTAGEPGAGPPDASVDERALVARALEGERDALEAVIGIVRDPVYRLALRMEWRPVDAEDATQEILIRVVTRLASWDGRAALTTWAFRVAVNHLQNRRRGRDRERMSFEGLTFEGLGAELDRSAGAAAYEGPDAALVATEVRLRCTQAMLQCLGPDERLAYVLGEIMGLPSREAAWIAAVGDAAFRKRLQRARTTIRAFTAGRCGLLDPAATCHCSRRATRAMRAGKLGRDQLELARHATSPTAPGAAGDDVAAASAGLAELGSAGALMRSHPANAAPGALGEAVERLLRSDRYPFVEPPARRP